MECTPIWVILALLLTCVCNVCNYCIICSFVCRWHLLSSMNVHLDIFWRFCLQTTSLSLCYYALAWVADMCFICLFLAQNVNCDVPIGWSCFYDWQPGTHYYSGTCLLGLFQKPNKTGVKGPFQKSSKIGVKGPLQKSSKTGVKGRFKNPTELVLKDLSKSPE